MAIKSNTSNKSGPRSYEYFVDKIDYSALV